MSLTPLTDLISQLRQQQLAVLKTEAKIAEFLLQLQRQTAPPAATSVRPAAAARPERTAQTLVRAILKDLPNPFWYPDVIRMLESEHPHAMEIKRVAYNGVAALERSNEVRRVAGGFEVVPTEAPATVEGGPASG